MFSSIKLRPFNSKATGEVGGSRPKAAPQRENGSEARMRKGQETAQGGAEL